MPKKLILHLVCLLLLFTILNTLVKYVVVPELNQYQLETQKKHQDDIASVLTEIPNLGGYLYLAKQYQQKINNNTIDKKAEIFAIDQQWKEPFIYFLQKQILNASQDFVKKESSTNDKSSFVMPAKKSEPQIKESDKSSPQTNDTTKNYFEDLAAQLGPNKAESILNNFQDHLKKLKPVLDKGNLEIRQFEKSIPDAITEKDTFLTDFHYRLSEGKEIHLAFLKLQNTPEIIIQPDAFKGVRAFYQINPQNEKTISLLPELTTPSIDWPQIQNQFSEESGHHLIRVNETTDIYQTWVKNKNRTITVLEMYWPHQKNFINETLLYDCVLFVFLILMGIWFYFFHESQNREKEMLTLPDELEALKKEKKQLEKLLIDTVEKTHKDKKSQTNSQVQTNIESTNNKEIETKANPKTELNTPEVFKSDEPKSYLLPKEQSYVDHKVDFQNTGRDILMEDSKTDMLKSLVKKIRERK